MSHRTCSIPGCDAPYHAHGWCHWHYDNWKRRGHPTAASRLAGSRLVSSRHVAEMLALADEGLGRMDIAACTGWSIRTVGKHVGHIVPARHMDQQPDLARYRRMIDAADAAEIGTRDDLARRFGLSGRKSFDVTLVKARRLVAAAAGEV